MPAVSLEDYRNKGLNFEKAIANELKRRNLSLSNASFIKAVLEQELNDPDFLPYKDQYCLNSLVLTLSQIENLIELYLY